MSLPGQARAETHSGCPLLLLVSLWYIMGKSSRAYAVISVQRNLPARDIEVNLDETRDLRER